MATRTRVWVLCAALCGATAAAAPLTTCRQAKGWTLEAGPRIPALGRVLRAHRAGADTVLEVSDGRAWTFSEVAGTVHVESGPMEALLCEGRLEHQVLDALVRESAALESVRTVGLCRWRSPGGDVVESPVRLSPVLGGGAVQVTLEPDLERLWTVVLSALVPRVEGSAVRCYASAGMHCAETPLPVFTWAPSTTVTLADDDRGESVRLSCNLEKDVLLRALDAAR